MYEQIPISEPRFIKLKEAGDNFVVVVERARKKLTQGMRNVERDPFLLQTSKRRRCQEKSSTCGKKV